MESLLQAARKHGRYRVRNSLMVLLGFHYGLRRQELALLRWDGINWADRQILIQRVKVSESGIHPIQADELVALGWLQAETQYGEAPCLWGSGGEVVGGGGESDVEADCGGL